MSDRMKIYMAHPISGLGYDEVKNYYNDTADILDAIGYSPLCPMTAKGYLRGVKEFSSHGIKLGPVSTDHAIFERDMWMVRESDIALIDFSGAKTVSIGCTMELMAAALLGKHTVVVMEPINVHRHAFILEAADIVFNDIDEAIGYMTLLAAQEIEDPEA